jgi:hypothetical protein
MKAVASVLTVTKIGKDRTTDSNSGFLGLHQHWGRCPFVVPPTLSLAHRAENAAHMSISAFYSFNLLFVFT